MSVIAEGLTDIDPSEVTQDALPGDPLADETPHQRRLRLRRERYAEEKAGTAQPRPKGRPPKSPKPDVKPKPGQRNLTGEIEALLEVLASVWMIRDEECGSVLAAQAHDIAAGLNAWAQRDPNVYKMLVKWLEGGGAGALAFALWPLGMQIANHHVLPAIERRRELLAERQAAFDAEWTEPEPLIQETPQAEPVERFIPPNIIPD